MTDSSGPERPGYALPSRSYQIPPERHTSHTRLFVILGVSLAVVIAVVIGLSFLLVKPPPKPHCPQDCHAPPIGPPVGNPPEVGGGPPVPTELPNPPAAATAQTAMGAVGDPVPRQVPHDAGVTVQAAPVASFPRFRKSDGSFAVSYPKGASLHPNGVSWTEDGGQAMFFSVPAKDLTPRQIAEQFVKADFPSATLGYVIPNARVGYQAGYGEIDDFVPQSGSGSYAPQRVLVMVAVKNGLALVTEAVGPFHQPEGEGHATGANLDIAGWLGYFVNSFSWNGDPPR